VTLIPTKRAKEQEREESVAMVGLALLDRTLVRKAKTAQMGK
jgi:hypothetical protein